MALTVGTAGHVDHGKTTLVCALTGKDTDRLPEEQARGISIDLGYAQLALPDGSTLSLVDVPGHERFVRTMVAGATGIDLFLLVVDAAEGARAQTHEHLAILRLLGIDRGVVAVTKADLVDDETLELAIEEARELAALRKNIVVKIPLIPEGLKAVRTCADEGIKVNVTLCFSATQALLAAKAGAELVLSVNSHNREHAADWGIEVVVVPDDPHTLAGLDDTIEYVASRGVPLRIDPILEPIGFGFANSLARYVDVRRRYPDAEMLMGIGNLTELTDADSAAVNVVLLGFCQELGIRSVLTTQVINWARTCVKECDLARRLVR